MTVTELIKALAVLFPRAPVAAWAEHYRTALGACEGERLATAYRLTMADWDEAGAPKPAHIAKNLPPLPRATVTDDKQEQWRRQDLDAQLARDRLDVNKRAELDRKFKAALAHLASASPPTRAKPRTIFKPLAPEAVERIRKEHGQ